VREIVCPVCGGHERRLLCWETFATEPGSSRPPQMADPDGVHYRANWSAGSGLVNSNPIFEEAGVAALYLLSLVRTDPLSRVQDRRRSRIRAGQSRLHGRFRGRRLDLAGDPHGVLGGRFMGPGNANWRYAFLWV
jgi:hypothetical protein